MYERFLWDWGALDWSQRNQKAGDKAQKGGNSGAGEEGMWSRSGGDTAQIIVSVMGYDEERWGQGRN